MREIKFRGKKVNNGERVEGSLHIGNSYWITQKSFDETKGLQPFRPIEVKTETVGQYTGLVDRHNKPIYEGDIVNTLTYDKMQNDFRFIERKGEIIYVSEDIVSLGGGFAIKTNIKTNLLGNFCNCKLEVIGNTHDNPELMEG